MKTLINILGTGRCGSTMLDAMLGNGDRCNSLGEVNAWFRPWRRHHFTLDCSCGLTSCSIWALLRNLKVNEFHCKAFELLDVDFLIDSSKSLTWLIDQQQWLAGDIRVFNVAIYKDPMELAYSNWKRNLPITVAWMHYKKYYSRLLALKYPFVTIRYRDLVENPRAKLLELCNLINMKCPEGKENFWKGDLHFLFGSKGVREQLQKKNSYFRKRSAYPKAFLVKQNEITNMLQKDLDMRFIREELNRREISEICDFSGVPNLLSKKTRFLPPWYYTKRLREVIGRYFPLNYSVS